MPRPTAKADASLTKYNAKRDFKVTSEPTGAKPKKVGGQAETLAFVIQKHWASRLHYDFRLELDGVLLSWAVPKGPSLDPAEKRMAVHKEDHPVSYGDFEGVIPPKLYGAGRVLGWDSGSCEPVGDPREGMQKGKLVFKLHGQKLAGLWELVRIAKPGDKQDPWMLFKKRDSWARPRADYDVVAALPDSVVETPLGLVEEREPRGVSPSDTSEDVEPDLAAAVKAALPQKLEPQLATLAWWRFRRCRLGICWRTPRPVGVPSVSYGSFQGAVRAPSVEATNPEPVGGVTRERNCIHRNSAPRCSDTADAARVFGRLFRVADDGLNPARPI